MPATQTASRLTEFARRGAGTDAERRAALWCAQELCASRREAVLEPFWCRPNWALAHAWHVLLALAGSLVIVSNPRVGGALVLVALLSVIADSLTGRSLGRRLTPERASQNVVSLGPAGPAPAGPAPAGPAPAGPAPAGRAATPGDDRLNLIITANYDAGRAGLVYRDAPRAVAAWWRRVGRAGRLTPGWVGWMALQLIWLLAVALARDGGSGSAAIGLLQLVPTVALVLELAALLELAGAAFGPGAGDNASGAAVALGLVRALDTAPPRRLRVELVLQGAGDGAMLGLTRHLRARRRELGPANTVVLGIGPCGEGRPAFWVSDGSLVPLRFPARLCRLAADAAAVCGHERASHHGRGTSPALPARSAGLPAVTIGCLSERELVPRSHQTGDVADALAPEALDALLELALTLVDALDADLGRATGRSGSARAVA